MSIDVSPLRDITEQVAEGLKSYFSEDPDRAPFIRMLSVVVELDFGPRTSVAVFCSDDRQWAQLAFLEHAVREEERKAEAQRYEP